MEKVESGILKRDTQLILNYNIRELRNDITNDTLVKISKEFMLSISNSTTVDFKIFVEYLTHLSGSENCHDGGLQLNESEIDHLLNTDMFKRIWLVAFNHELKHHTIGIHIPTDSLMSPVLMALVHLQVGKKEWDRVYTSNEGKSYILLLQKLETCNECLVIMKDGQGSVFGFYSFDAFDVHPKFYGSSSNFLFSSNPLRIYNSTGYNSNFLYFNHGQKTLINGIGLGGQMDYFGLFIDEDFNGHSRAEPNSTTYGNPQLSHNAEFSIDTVEVYCMVQRKAKDNAKSSILDDYAASNLLEMSGRKMYSKDVVK